MASAVGCDNVRDDLAAFVLLAEIKNISAVKEKNQTADYQREAFSPSRSSEKQAALESSSF